MGTRANTRIVDSNHDIILYTRYDGFEDEIKQSIKTLEVTYREWVKEVKSGIEGFEIGFPLLSRWCIEIEEYLNQPMTAKKVATLLSGKSFHHHNADYGLTDSRDGKLSADVSYRVEQNDFRRGKTPRPWVKDGAAGDEVSGFIFSHSEDGFLDKCSTLVSAEEFGEDLVNLGAFFSEMSFLRWHLEARGKDIKERNFLEDFYFSNLKRIDGGSPYYRGDNLEGLLEDVNRGLSLPFGNGIYTPIFAFFRPGRYELASEQEAVKPTLVFEVTGDRMGELKVVGEKENVSAFAKEWLAKESEVSTPTVDGDKYALGKRLVAVLYEERLNREKRRSIVERAALEQSVSFEKTKRSAKSL